MGGFSNFAISFSIISHPDRRGHPLRLRPGLGGQGRRDSSAGRSITIFVLRIAASMAEIASAYPDRRRPVLLGQPDEEQELGLVDRLAQPDRPVRDRRRHQLRRGRLPQRHDHRAASSAPGRSRNTTEIIPGILNGQLVTMGILMLIAAGDEHRRASTSSRSSTRSACGGTSPSSRPSSCSSSWPASPTSPA